MPVLTSEVLPNHGPYIKIAGVPQPLEIGEGDWPERSMYQEHVFFELADDLVDTLCSVSRSYLFFDPYGFEQFCTPEDAFGFISGLFTLAARIAACPVHHFAKELSIYECSSIPEASRTMHQLKADLCETLIFISDRSAAVSREGKCVVIIGI